MKPQNPPTIDALQAEVTRLKKRLERERNARNQVKAIADQSLRDLYHQQKQLKLLQVIAVAANEAPNYQAALQTALHEICAYMNWPVGHAYLLDEETQQLIPTKLWHLDDEAKFRVFKEITEQTTFPRGIGLPGTVMTQEQEWIPDVTQCADFLRGRLAKNIGVRAAFAFAVTIGTDAVAALEFFSETPADPDWELMALMQHIGAQLGQVFERKRSEAYIHEQFERLVCLRTIDMAIASSVDLSFTLHLFLDQARALLGIPAADILLCDPHTMKLHHAAGKGFFAATHRNRYQRQDYFAANRAMMERDILQVDYALGLNASEIIPYGAEEGFIGYFAVPLLAKGQIKGVLELYYRQALNCDTNWLDFLSSLAGQAAIAIDSASLFNDLQRSNMELTLAYDATIEGWSRALDLRDKETEGHSRRVTDMTLRLARILGIDDRELVHIRRGSLLHDIGKMGIPDSILLKPGPLTPEERKSMQRHPEFAHEMLFPIAFLRPALDIPFCHHEKWDGTGYPRGLKEEQIPLPARIFALVDVWDALSFDRPYRKAWNTRRVQQYLRAQTGAHFDPHLANIFLQMLADDEREQEDEQRQQAA